LAAKFDDPGDGENHVGGGTGLAEGGVYVGGEGEGVGVWYFLNIDGVMSEAGSEQDRG